MPKRTRYPGEFTWRISVSPEAERLRGEAKRLRGKERVVAFRERVAVENGVLDAQAVHEMQSLATSRYL